MRTIMIVLLLSGLCGLGCRNTEKGNELTGTYVRGIENEYGTGEDTIWISPGHENSYQIQRSIATRSILDGKLMDKKQRKRRWDAIYDPATGQLTDEVSGQRLRMLPDSGALYLGTARFVKIN